MKLWKTSILVVLYAVISAWSSDEHEYYVSVGEMDFNPTSGQLEITHRIFTDDLEFALEKSGISGVDVLNDEHASDLVECYLREHFKIFTEDGNELNYTCLGTEGDSDALSVFLETDEVKSEQILQVFNDVLIETYPAQLNILHVKSGESVLSYRFDEDTKVQLIKI